LLRNVKVAARVAELKEQAAKGAVMTAREVLEELSKLGRANMADYMKIGPDGDPVLNFAELSRDQAAALVEVTVEDFLDGRGEDAREVRKVKFKLADKRGALDLLGKHLGLFRDRVEHTGKDGGPMEVKQYSDIEAARLIGRLLTKVSGSPPGAVSHEPDLGCHCVATDVPRFMPVSPARQSCVYGAKPLTPPGWMAP
jgi:phage terminase small subunit